ncbi:MAG: redox-sensing transcriptional repressor Rex [Clostridia bacterium]|nr:redox-sensing transcriptional repressor Rex [Clostridia bacterium]
MEDLEKSREKAANYRISSAVIKRLPRYFRYLRELLEAGRMRISSGELSKMMHVTASQIRQDLNCFGGFGQQGYGYNVKYLYSKISEILGVEEHYRAVIIGAGHLGLALVGSPMFSKRGVTLTALFDNSPDLVGKEYGSLHIYDIAELDTYIKRNNIDIAVLTLPRMYAKETAERLASLGIRGIWNFTNVELDLEELGITVQNVHIGDSLMQLTYRVHNADEIEDTE